jgi:hypothetical protein
VRLSADVALRLRDYCRASDQSINATVEAALTEYLDRKKDWIMALAPCRECQKQVSTEAPSCPHCGARRPVSNQASVPREELLPIPPAERIKREIAGAVIHTPPRSPEGPGIAANRSRVSPLALTLGVAAFVLVSTGAYMLGRRPANDAPPTAPSQAAAPSATQNAAVPTGELSGDVFVTMKSGDVKRGADMQISLVGATEQFEAAWKKTVEEFAASRQAREVRARYLALAQKMVADAQPRIARTDVNGHYQFQGVPAGRYYVFAERRVFDNDLRWKVVAEVKAGANRIDLSNSNAGWPF